MVLAADDALLPADPGAAAADSAAAEQQQDEAARSVLCECCGMAEDCTPTYIGRVRERFGGRWVCGICAEAVSEARRRDPALAVREAVASHEALCAEFNATLRANPALCLARSMRDIVRISCRARSGVSAPSAASGGGSGARIGRTRSCALPYRRRRARPAPLLRLACYDNFYPVWEPHPNAKRALDLVLARNRARRRKADFEYYFLPFVPKDEAWGWFPLHARDGRVLIQSKYFPDGKHFPDGELGDDGEYPPPRFMHYAVCDPLF
uniref:DUF1677 family protein n=1 Tax=Leersia perrieri TaxID=77586 RepID=A0A0D9V5J7_9ORYZ